MLPFNNPTYIGENIEHSIQQVFGNLKLKRVDNWHYNVFVVSSRALETDLRFIIQIDFEHIETLLVFT